MKNTLNKLKELSVMCIDDNQESLIQITEALTNLFDKCYSFDSALKAEEFLKEKSCDIIICDIEMPQKNGLEFIKDFREESFDTPIVVLTAYTKSDYLFESSNLNIQAYIVKPVNFNKLKEAFEKCLKHIELKRPIFSKIEGYDYNKNSATLKNDSVAIKLNKKEARLFNLLLESKNHVVSYEQIERVVWAESSEGMSGMALRTLVKTLREKTQLKSIKNHSGSGYMLEIN